jgi:hypothetical protein
MKSRPFRFPSPGPLLGLLSLGFVALAADPLQADINSDLAFSAFQNVDVNALADGQVLQARGGLLTFPRGITSQSLFVIKGAAPADVAKKLTTWNPTDHPELQVWAHLFLPAKPTAADFAALANLPDNKSVNFQIDSTANFDPSHPSLQVGKEEAQFIATTAAQEKDPKALFVKVWSQILTGRINDMFSGRGASDYDIGSDGTIHPVSEVKSLLHSDIKVYGQYQRLVNQTPFKALGGGAGKMAPVNLYADVFDVEGSAAMGTGAIYQAPYGNSIQSLDVEYYTNYGVYVTIEMEEMWPVTAGGQAATLVWRDDLVSAPNIAYLHGTERLASGMIMLQETKQGVDSFRAEFH